jgi:hypothetical protein
MLVFSKRQLTKAKCELNSCWLVGSFLYSFFKGGAKNKDLKNGLQKHGKYQSKSDLCEVFNFYFTHLFTPCF